MKVLFDRDGADAPIMVSTIASRDPAGVTARRATAGDATRWDREWAKFAASRPKGEDLALPADPAPEAAAAPAAKKAAPAAKKLSAKGRSHDA